MKFILAVAFLFSSQLFASSTEPHALSQLLDGNKTLASETQESGFCEKSVACPDGKHTAYCKATGPYTRCTQTGSYGVLCIAWNSKGHHTHASEQCP